MAKDTFLAQVKAYQVQMQPVAGTAPKGAVGAFGLPWYVPSWLVAQAIAIALTALTNLPKTEAGKKLMKEGFQQLDSGIHAVYPDFDCE